MQYFVVGIVSSALPATLYGFFLGYLGVSSYVYATATQVVSLPWSFKVLFGMINDCFPLRGLSRKPYMVIGWTLCTLALASIACVPMPAQGSKKVGMLSGLMAIAAVGYIIADVAADGLLVEIAKRELDHVRGTTQTNVYLVRTIGGVVASLLVGLGMNGREYNGTMDRSPLSFTQVCGLLAIPSAMMIPVSWLYVHETRKPPCSRVVYINDVRGLISKKGMFYLVVYSLAHSSFGDISTTASGNVTKIWAGVHNLQAQLNGIVGAAIFAGGLVVVKKYLLNYNWRKIIIGCTITLIAIDAMFVFCTIFDVVRNQYFYLGEAIVTMVPAAARFMVTSFVVVEVAPKGQEGLTYGLLTTLHNLGGPVARGISNQVMTIFPGIAQPENYIKDTPEFRWLVAWSYIVSYACALLALGLLPLLPSQKAQAKERMQWPASKRWLRWTAGITTTSFVYALTMNLLAMSSYSCMRIVGGDGCNR